MRSFKEVIFDIKWTIAAIRRKGFYGWWQLRKRYKQLNHFLLVEAAATQHLPPHVPTMDDIEKFKEWADNNKVGLDVFMGRVCNGRPKRMM